MDDAFLVGCGERVGHLATQIDDLLQVERLLVDHRLKGVSFEQLHDDEGLAVMLSQVVDRADVGVVESRSGPGLSLKALQGRRALGQLLRQELQSDLATEVQVLGCIDHTHSPATEAVDDTVVGDGFADHESRLVPSMLQKSASHCTRDER